MGRISFKATTPNISELLSSIKATNQYHNGTNMENLCGRTQGIDIY